MGEPFILDPDESLLYEFDFSDEIEEGASLVSAVVGAPAPVQAVIEIEDFENSRVFVRISGARHHLRFVVEVTGALSNGDVVNQGFSFLGMNS